MGAVMRQRIVWYRASGEPDIEGNPQHLAPVTLKARVDEEESITTNQSGQNVTAKLTVLLRGLSGVKAGDMLEYTDEAGVSGKYLVVSRNVLRDRANKPQYTEVKAK